MSALGNAKVTLGSAVANAGTFTVAYPAGTNQALLDGTTGGKVAVNDNDVYPQAPSGAGTFAFAFGASNITVTNNTGASLPAGTELILSFGRNDINGSYNLTYPKQVQDQVADLETRVADLETP